MLFKNKLWGITMAQQFAKKLYNSARWKRCRAAYIAKVYGICERCGEPGYIVHHKVVLNSRNIDDCWVTLNHSNLELLCVECHNKEHMSEGSATVEGLMFDSSGQLVRCE